MHVVQGKKKQSSLTGVGRYRYFFFLYARSGAGPDSSVSAWQLLTFYRQAFPEQIGNVFIHFCVPTFFPTSWWCWNWAIKTTWTHRSCHAFSKPPCVWRPWRCQSSKKPCYRGNPCSFLLRYSYFTELLETTVPWCPIPTEDGAFGFTGADTGAGSGSYRGGFDLFE